ncbi:hypothetical protein ENSA7_64890 [Enhygromyxa salina]|uniref:Uncharacterized protein n=1 Tax=Enhygromyxa salina TaxID=215803 RepID=A0A2S9Y0C3_9BACT|nr:hypothetical protein ENSA7_64890 [Enhygromyxa salina]
MAVVRPGGVRRSGRMARSRGCDPLRVDARSSGHPRYPTDAPSGRLVSSATSRCRDASGRWPSPAATICCATRIARRARHDRGTRTEEPKKEGANPKRTLRLTSAYGTLRGCGKSATKRTSQVRLKYQSQEISLQKINNISAQPAQPELHLFGCDISQHSELVECCHCVQLPESPCPLCHGWGWLPRWMNVVFGLCSARATSAEDVIAAAVEASHIISMYQEKNGVPQRE